jgi:hypothetical protein
MKSLQTNKSQYVVKFAEKLNAFTNQAIPQGSAAIKAGASEVIVQVCLDALEKYCKGVNTPENYDIASHLMCWSVKYSPFVFEGSITADGLLLDSNSANGYFAIQTAVEMLGLDVKKILTNDKTFLKDTNNIIQSNPQRSIEGQINNQIINLRHLCESY